MTDTILTLLHGEDSTPGKVGRFLEARGYQLQACRAVAGDSLPPDLSAYAAVVVFGGPQSANDDHDPGIRAELEWLERTALPAGLPLLGICLGAQQIARVLGAAVGPHPEGRVEIGYYEIEPTAAGRDFLDGTSVFYQWHAETFEIPPGAVHLATSREFFSAQAYRYNEHVHGLEFHPEMTLEMIDLWSSDETSAPKLELPGAQDREAHLHGYRRHAEASDRWLNRFLDAHFLAGTATA